MLDPGPVSGHISRMGKTLAYLTGQMENARFGSGFTPKHGSMAESRRGSDFDGSVCGA